MPGFAKRPTDVGQFTTTFHVHYRFDYYRFSRRAMREVFLEGFDGVKVATVLDPPRIIGHGFKPINRRQKATRVARRKVSAVRRRLSRRR